MSETQDKLNWLAFRYVANELDATEVSKFESLLMADQTAREAVAAAVDEAIQIRHALAGEGVGLAAAQRPTWSRKTTRVAMVVFGSCLTLFLAIYFAPSSSPIVGEAAREQAASDSPDSHAQLAYAWAETRRGLTDFQPVANPELVDSLDAVLVAAVDSESEPSLVAPSWMLAALATMDGGIDSLIEVQE